MELLVLLAVVAGLVWLVAGATRRGRQREHTRRERELAEVRSVAEEDVTRFGEELQGLDDEMRLTPLDTPTRQDYQRALDSYERAKTVLDRITEPADVRHVTEALEDGRYAAACVLARRDGAPLPVRRPPCFFNPAHGPSSEDVEWAPSGGVPRQVPVCAADADRVAQGAEPDIRTVPQGLDRVPYWQAGPAYSPWATGYFGAYAASNLLPSFLLLSLLSPAWHGEPVAGSDFGVGEAADPRWEGYDGLGSDNGGFDSGGFDGGGFDGGF